MSEFERLQREIETGERWLRGLGEPAAPVGMAERIKSSIRAEQTRAGRPAGTRILSRWQGALAAAAMIAISATVIWRGSSLERARVDRVRAVEQFATSLERVDATDASLALLGDEIDAVVSTTKSELDASIDELGDSIDSASSDSTSSL